MITKCVNPACHSPHASLAAKGLCWPCYQSQRREGLPKKHVAPCVSGRRYHSYNDVDKCKHCGAKRVFNI